MGTTRQVAVVGAGRSSEQASHKRRVGAISDVRQSGETIATPLFPSRHHSKGGIHVPRRLRSLPATQSAAIVPWTTVTPPLPFRTAVARCRLSHPFISLWSRGPQFMTDSCASRRHER